MKLEAAVEKFEEMNARVMENAAKSNADYQAERERSKKLVDQFADKEMELRRLEDKQIKQLDEQQQELDQLKDQMEQAEAEMKRQNEELVEAKLSESEKNSELQSTR